MSYDNAISKRAQMNLDYQKMLDEESDPTRQEAIKKQIKLNEDEIQQLRQGKPLFGQPPILKQETKIIEQDPETKGQKITTLDEKGKPIIEEKIVTKEVAEPETDTPTQPSTKKIGNALRDKLKAKTALSEEESLKAKVQEAKRSRAKFN